MKLRKGTGAAGLACAMLTLLGGTPAAAHDGRPAGDVRRAMDELARTPGVVGAIAGHYVDGRRAGRCGLHHA
ncbi:hypothetical protein [Spongiactinospora sp. 9N601]|uniref:hypothetical protein n=1 Tax=Spongiactinospora sp. 9N601 TaxID=3375149 RepID=UPI0037B685BF